FRGRDPADDDGGFLGTRDGRGAELGVQPRAWRQQPQCGTRRAGGPAFDLGEHAGNPQRAGFGAGPAAGRPLEHMKSLVIVPGDAPRWVADHARHLAQRLTEIGRVTVVTSARQTSRSLLPGQPGNGSVLGHSVAGYPIWTG